MAAFSDTAFSTSAYSENAFSFGQQVAEETTVTGGWPSYGYRRKKKKRIEEVEEKIESQEIEIDDIEKKLAAERQERGRLESKKRLKAIEEQALARLKAEIAADLEAIEEMRRIHDELLTLRYLEQAEDRKRKKRNQLIVLMMEA